MLVFMNTLHVLHSCSGDDWALYGSFFEAGCWTFMDLVSVKVVCWGAWA